MKHYTLEQWDRYTGDQLSDTERSVYEQHLSSCDPCLELYMQSLERAAGSYPKPDDPVGLAEAVMEQIGTEELPASSSSLRLSPVQSPHLRKNRTAPAFTKHPLFHYAVAASITVILMGSGAFQSLTDRIGSLDSSTEAARQAVEQGEDQTQPEKAVERTSVSYKIMEKTIVMLDSIQPKHDKGGDR